MDLKTYFKHQRGRQRNLAKALGLADAHIWQIANGLRVAAPELCVAIERATEGDVRRWDLRPEDWHRIWPELIDTVGAPTPADPQQARVA